MTGHFPGDLQNLGICPGGGARPGLRSVYSNVVTAIKVGHLRDMVIKVLHFQPYYKKTRTTMHLVDQDANRRLVLSFDGPYGPQLESFSGLTCRCACTSVKRMYSMHCRPTIRAYLQKSRRSYRSYAWLANLAMHGHCDRMHGSSQ